MARRPTEIPIERRVRVRIFGLGQVYDLCVTCYQGNPDAEIVALCDVEPGRVDERAGNWPNAERFIAFRASCDHMLHLRTGDGEIRLNGDQSRDVLAFVPAAMESSRTRVPVQLV